MAVVKGPFTANVNSANPQVGSITFGPSPGPGIGAPYQHASMDSNWGPPSTGDLTFTLNNFKTAPRNFLMKTELGDISINLDTGDLTIPPGVGRDEAIREFWLGFHRDFKTGNKELQDKIDELQRANDYILGQTESYQKECIEKTTKAIVDKIAKKYANDKFIMIKPDDLIKLIKEEA